MGPGRPVWVEKLDSQPLGVGSRYRGKWKRFGKAEWTFTTFDPPQESTHDAKVSGIRMIHRLRFDDQDGTTRFHQTLEVKTAKALELLLGPLMKTALKKRMAQLGDELKDYTERRPT